MTATTAEVLVATTGGVGAEGEREGGRERERTRNTNEEYVDS